jgi:hypothetical protein
MKRRGDQLIYTKSSEKRVFSEKKVKIVFFQKKKVKNEEMADPTG